MRLAIVAWILATALALAAEPTPRPLPAEKAAQTMTVPEGFRATLFAAEPDVVQPISFCLDDRGRLFVAEALNYGAWQPAGKDRIIILEDTDGDGRADSRKVFYEGLNYVTGIEVGFGGVWVMSVPKLYFIPDRDRDDKPDSEPQVLFDGFGYRESRHNLANGFTWGPDGWLYAGHGRTSPSDVGRPGTPAAERIHCDGGVVRIHPTRLIFENFADGTTNPWGVDFDDYGQCFVCNCVNPHLFHMLQGGHYEPWRNRPSSLYAYERLPTCADHWHFPTGKANAMRGETQEVLAMGGGHAHCGTLVYLGDTFPAEYRNTVFMCNIHGRRINHDLLKRRGSGYTAAHGKDFMLAADPWFMGVTLQTGPAGNIFVSDWSDTGECHTYKPERDTGRIHSIAYGSPRLPSVDLAKQSDEELVKLQRHANDWYVRHARRLLQERAAQPGWKGEAVHASLRAMLDESRDVPRRLRALWALHVTGGIDAHGLQALLDDEHEHLRAWSIQLMCENQSISAETLRRFAALAKSDPSPVVRLYLAAALQRLPKEQCWTIAEGLVSHAEDAADANLPLMYWYGIEPLVPADPSRALQLAGRAQVPLLRQYIARRWVENAIAKKLGTLAPLVRSLAEMTETYQQDLLIGAREGLRGQKRFPMPEPWPAVYARLAKSAVPAIAEHAAALALLFGDPQALVNLRRKVQAAGAPPAERQTALAMLLEAHTPDLAPLLQGLLADPAVRRLAVRGLASYANEATPRHIVNRYAEFAAEEKQDAVATLASRKEYAAALLEAVEQKRIPSADISAYVARQLHALGDERIRDRLRQCWGEVRDSAPDKKKQLARYKSLLTPSFVRRADVSNGRALFQKTCQQCHMLFGEGGKIGPDLTGANRGNLDYLLSNLVDPSAEIGQDYRMSIVTTKDGRVITGILVERSASRVTIQTATERLVLSPDDVEDVKNSPLSIMPEGQLDTLTKEQVRDLIGYVAATKQTSLPGDSNVDKR